MILKLHWILLMNYNFHLVGFRFFPQCFLLFFFLHFFLDFSLVYFSVPDKF